MAAAPTSRTSAFHTAAASDLRRASAASQLLRSYSSRTSSYTAAVCSAMPAHAYRSRTSRCAALRKVSARPS
ncbi:MAG: hypothetical protein DIU83_03765, partial [Bacillota bacterium]